MTAAECLKILDGIPTYPTVGNVSGDDKGPLARAARKGQDDEHNGRIRSGRAAP